MRNKKIIAITGNIGSGKSTVMGMLKNRGYKAVSADECTSGAYEIVTPELLEVFGYDIYENGEINRKKLGEKVFSSAENLAKLNAIMHPVIFDMMFQKAGEAKVCFCEVPLLFESGMENYFDGVWLVTAKAENKISRAAKRDNASEEEIKKRLSFQKNDEEKTGKVHIIIENDGDIATLEKKVQTALNEI